jgi:hypothetical protein
MILTYFTSIYKQKTRHIGIYMALLLICSLILNACKKTETDENVYGALSVVNASPTVATYDFYLSGSKINSVPVPAGGGIPYSQRVVGNYDLKFTIAGSIDNLITKNIAIAANSYQTYFLIGRPGALDGVLVTDNRTAASDTQGYIRFVNVAPDAPALDLFIQGGVSLATNKAYKSISEFVPINAGNYTFDIRENSSGNVKTSTENLAVKANTYYTVLAKGLIIPSAGGIELPLSANIITNK